MSMPLGRRFGALFFALLIACGLPAQTPHQDPRARAEAERLIRQQRYDEALQLLERLGVRTPDDPVVDAFIGECHYGAGRHEQAVDGFARCLAKDPSLVASMPHYPLSLIRLDRLDDAWKAYEAMGRHATNDAGRMQSAFGLGLVLIHRGEEKAALPHLVRAHELAPTSRKVNSRLGLLYRSLGKLEDAVRHFELALRHYGLHESAAHNLALIQNQLGNREEAKRWQARHREIRAATERLGNLARLLQEHPGDASILTELAETNERFDCPDAAANWYGTLARLRSRDPEPLVAMARCLVHGGRHQRALAPLQRALTLAPGHAEAQALLAELREHGKAGEDAGDDEDGDGPR